jgi:hypothetical protein
MLKPICSVHGDEKCIDNFFVENPEENRSLRIRDRWENSIKCIIEK